jgi:hypothetical protein
MPVPNTLRGGDASSRLMWSREGDVEEAQDDPCPRSQLLQPQGYVQIGKVGIAQQAARTSPLYARLPERLLQLGVADD